MNNLEPFDCVTAEKCSMWLQFYEREMSPSMNENMDPNWLIKMGALTDNFTSRQIIMIMMMLMI